MCAYITFSRDSLFPGGYHFFYFYLFFLSELIDKILVENEKKVIIKVIKIDDIIKLILNLLNKESIPHIKLLEVIKINIIFNTFKTIDKINNSFVLPIA